MRLPLLIALLFMVAVSCKESSGFNWAAQPHQDTIPPVIGKWFDPAVTVRVDPLIYHASDDSTAIPAYMAPQADANAALDSVISYCKDFGLTYTRIPEKAQVTLHFYYAPWRSRRTSQVLTTTGAPFLDAVVVSEKTPSADEGPPAAGSNYLGLCRVTAPGKAYQACTVWLNVYVYEDYRLQAVAHPELQLDWRIMGRDTLQWIVWHEMFHTVGLNDDAAGSVPGLMVYRSRLNRPSLKEREVANWLYQK